MKRVFITLLSVVCLVSTMQAQQDFNQINDRGEVTPADDWKSSHKKDTTKHDKEIPIGMKVWTVDERFGDRTAAIPDTLPHMYMNSVFTTGRRGEFNTTGNLGAPRINRIFIDRSLPEQFMFTQPYDFFITPVDKFHFTNTLSPITNVSYDECGDKNVGEDHLKALFAVNAGKKTGLGFKFDYIYGRGYYQNQSTAHFNYTMYASHMGDRYQAHLLLSTNHEKVAENGGITNDDYVSHPEIFRESFRTDEIPTVLNQNWNRNDNQHIFLTHRYNIGFNRKVPMTEEEIKAKKFAMEAEKEKAEREAKEKERKKAMKEGRQYDEDAVQNTYAGRPDDAKIAGDEPAGDADAASDRIAVTKQMADSLLAANKKAAEDTSWLKNEFVPVTSLIHTLKVDNYRRIYQAYATPSAYYLNTYLNNQELQGDSIFDKMRHYDIKNTLALSLLEGFNKWAKAGLKAFITSDLRNFSMPDTCLSGYRSFREHNLSFGGQISKTEGTLLHYTATLETWITGEDAGQLKFDGSADLNFKLFGDTVQLAARGYFYQLQPTFYQRNYHAKHLWWDNDGERGLKLSKEIRTRIEGLFTYQKTRTSVRVAVDDLKDHIYFAQQYTLVGENRTANTVSVKQNSGNISLLTVQVGQDFTFGPLNWESQVTWQNSSNNEVLPVPDFNIYSNLYLHFKIARVLKVDLGADVRYFTKYYVPDYSPMLAQFTVQDNGENNVELGNYPIVNVYANMHLKHTRFFLMMSHVNAGDGGNRFFVPHYPMNGMILRFGVSWNFFN